MYKCLTYLSSYIHSDFCNDDYRGIIKYKHSNWKIQLPLKLNCQRTKTKNDEVTVLDEKFSHDENSVDKNMDKTLVNAWFSQAKRFK